MKSITRSFSKLSYFSVLLLSLPVFICPAQNGRTADIIADHTSVAAFSQIPDSVLTSTIALKMMLRHASIGFTITNALDCIQGTRTSPKACNDFPDYKYDRRNWVFEARGNSGWYGKIRDFVNEVNRQIDTYDVFSFKYCYLDGLDQVAEPCGGASFNPALVKKAFDSLRINMEMLESKYPDKRFIWWTIPLTQPGQRCTDTLNYLIRQYVKQNNKLLFDIADIESWDTLNQHLTSPEGWEMAFSGYCGEKPPGPSCHPNWTGSIMLGKALWWLMASVAGFADTSSSDSLPVLTTSAVTSVTSTSAVCGGNITDDGGSNIIARGVVWHTAPNPSISLGTKTSEGTGTGTFSSQITGLTPNTNYYIRAYATNTKGTAYGNERIFNTNLTAVMEEEQSSVKIYPHPATKSFNLWLPAGKKEVSIINSAGQIVFRKLYAYEMNTIIEGNYSGIFILQVITEHQAIYKRIIFLAN